LKFGPPPTSNLEFSRLLQKQGSGFAWFVEGQKQAQEQINWPTSVEFGKLWSIEMFGQFFSLQSDRNGQEVPDFALYASCLHELTIKWWKRLKSCASY
jgi:hypothetical protein